MRRRSLGYLGGFWLALLSTLPFASLAADNASLEKLAQALSKRGASSAEYQQTRYLDMLDKPLESRGILRYRPPDYLVQQQTEPSAQTLTLDGDQLILKAEGRERRLSLSENPEGAAIASSLRGILNGRIDALQHDYDVAFRDFDDGQWGLKLDPRTEALAKRIAGIVVRGRLEDGVATVERLTIEHTNGNVNVMQITHRDDAP
ncbi:outer membrane lipoprotein carrier protein LolA [Guyparkeria hydrothermalis]|uniref:outer membrane lipoprotein carrier protein LolA n=1 Tax=Guyparkeria hydrothermalis TaxID=923 RepID=UPI002021B2BB|nr:outer membrane lipoprotein carrier protein LolA [Guyparkeria hydrothermalis]MCL7743812.1 outer membrane lipoprotein carrier protein LolA [Guyparkeria hydrothermalis]